MLTMLTLGRALARPFGQQTISVWRVKKTRRFQKSQLPLTLLPPPHLGRWALLLLGLWATGEEVGDMRDDAVPMRVRTGCARGSEKGYIWNKLNQEQESNLVSNGVVQGVKYIKLVKWKCMYVATKYKRVGWVNSTLILTFGVCGEVGFEDAGGGEDELG